jgi:TRAP transporter TAXI family solute receptor
LEGQAVQARADAGITSVSDLRGKRVNMGNPGSGTRENAVDVLRVYGMDWSDISDRELEAHEAVRALRRGKIDAFFFTVGNPWPGGVELAKRTKIRMIPINAPEIKKLVTAHPYCVHTAIPGGVYEGVDKDVPTYALKATLVTSEKVSEKVVYNVVKTVFDNLDRFRTMHPAFATLQPQDMLQALSAPLHPGAIRYYKEKGWM